MIYKITYAGGSMTIDLLPFIEKRTIADAKYLASKIVGISFDRARISREMITEVQREQMKAQEDLDRIAGDLDRIRRDRHTGAEIGRLERVIKKYDRFIAALVKIA